MPVRLNVLPPGEFIKRHLAEQPGRRDYVGGIFRAYKEHLVSQGTVKVLCRQTFHGYVWLLKEVGALAFDGAEAVSFGDEPAEALPPDYVPACASPAPRHFYVMTDPQHPGFDNPRGTWNQQQGIAVAAPPRRPTRPPTRISRIEPAPPPPAPAPTRRRRRTAADRLEEEGVVFRERIEALRESEDLAELAQLEDDMLAWFDRVLDAAEGASGEDRTRLADLGSRVETAAEGFQSAREALAGDQPPQAYQDALDVLLACCPT